MMKRVSKSRWARAGSRQEDGFLLLGVLFMILLIMIALAIAAPKIADSIRRDKEQETIQRGKQYARAIRMYYNKFGRYPNTIDQLVKTNDQRFLRKRYLDPMTGKDDWRIIHNGEQKVAATGLFGQAVQQNGITPTGASTTTGTGTAGSIGSSSPFGSSAGSPGTSASNGSSSLGSSGSGFGSSGSSFGSGSSSSPFGGMGSSTSPIGGTDSSSSSGFGSSAGIGGTTTNGAAGTNTNNIGGVQTTGGSNSAFGSPGVSVGGAPIVGVGLTDKRASIKVYKKQTHYNQWEFVFDQNQMALDAAAGGVAGATSMAPLLALLTALDLIRAVGVRGLRTGLGLDRIRGLGLDRVLDRGLVPAMVRVQITALVLDRRPARRALLLLRRAAIRLSNTFLCKSFCKTIGLRYFL